jgi:hypothetical protein
MAELRYVNGLPFLVASELMNFLLLCKEQSLYHLSALLFFTILD